MKPIDFENTSAKSPFKVPENYFEESMQRVFSQINEEIELKPSRGKLIFMEMRKWAAIFIVGLLGVGMYFSVNKKQEAEFTLEDYLSYQLQWQSVEHENMLDDDDILELEMSLNIDAVAVEYYLSRQDIEDLITEIEE